MLICLHSTYNISNVEWMSKKTSLYNAKKNTIKKKVERKNKYAKQAYIQISYFCGGDDFLFFNNQEYLLTSQTSTD